MGNTYSSFARLLQLWYFLSFVSTVEADQLLLSAVGSLILLVAIVVQRVLLRRHIFSDILLIVVTRVFLVLKTTRFLELLRVAWGGCTSISLNHSGDVLDKFDGFAEPVFCGIFHVAWVGNWQKQDYSLNDGPSVVAKSAENGEHEESAEGEERRDVASSAALVPVGVQVDATLADVAGDLAIALSHFIVAELFALLSPHLLLTTGLVLLRLFFASLEAGSLAICPGVTHVTLEVHLIAGTWLDSGDGLVLLTVEALAFLLSAHKGLMLAEEALRVAEASIVRCP